MGLKKTRKSSETLGFFIMLFFFVAVPLFMIKAFVTSASRSNEKKSESQIVKVLDSQENDESSSSQIESLLRNIKSQAEGAESSTYGKKYVIEKDGLYKLEGPVTDLAGLLDQESYSYIENFLLLLSEKTSVQIGVLLLPELEGEDIASTAIAYAEKWKLGSDDTDNGALLTVALAEHQVRIDTGYGSEGELTDAKCSRIIRSVIVPSFRAGNYSAGIKEAVENIAGIICGDESLVSISRNEASTNNDTLPFVIFMLFWGVFIFVVIFGVSRGGSSHRGPVSGWTSHSGRSSFGSSFGSSGTSSGFRGGGGSFGGGGAGGSW